MERDFGRPHLIWIVSLSLTLLLAQVTIGFVACKNLSPPKGLESIGGSWQVVKHPSPFEGPGTTYELFREKESGLVGVDESITRYRFYAPDCVVYQTIRPMYSGTVFAVCRERTPVAFMSDVGWNWEYAAEGLLLPKGMQLTASTLVVQATLLKPIERIVALALRQPQYRTQWQKDAGFRQDGPYTNDLVEDFELKGGPQ